MDLATADVSSTRLPLTGPFQGSPGEGRLWEYGSDTAKVQIIDGCDLSGSYWTVAAAVTDEPLELVIADPQAGTTVSQVLWTDRESVSDSRTPPACPPAPEFSIVLSSNWTISGVRWRARSVCCAHGQSQMVDVRRLQKPERHARQQVLQVPHPQDLPAPPCSMTSTDRWARRSPGWGSA